jgi:hypothetical protein
VAFDDLVSTVNAAIVSTFGKEYAFTRVESEEEGEELTITGVLDTGYEPEDRPPGDGSIYARFWLQASDIDPAPENGDEIASATTVYKIVRSDNDAGGGLWLLLRKDRSV